MSRGIDHRHCKWPLSTPVMVKTPDGYLRGTVNRHYEDSNGCDISFDVTVDMGDANGRRYSHHIPFRSMKPVDKVKRLARPWYKELGL